MPHPRNISQTSNAPNGLKRGGRFGWKRATRDPKMCNMKTVGRVLVALVLATTCNSAATSEQIESATCYDALVWAKLLRQIPSVMHDCGADCIIMRWPWFDDLDIQGVVAGRAPTGRVMVLVMQHTYLVSSHFGRWPLRRNELGGFNVVDGGQLDQMRACPPNTPAARPYISPAKGETLADVIREGEERYGEGPEAHR